MILFIAVLALAAVFVSQRLSSQKSVSPNAPESKPMAARKCGDAGTSGFCGVTGGCGYGEMCTSRGPADDKKFECVQNNYCPQPRECNASVVQKCSKLGGCLNGQRCVNTGNAFQCITDRYCYLSGGGGASEDCSRASAANCQGKSDGDSCGTGKVCNALAKQLGTDGKSKCTCQEK